MQPRTKKILLITLPIVAVILISVAFIFWMAARSAAPDQTVDEDPRQESVTVQPLVLETNDAYVRYLQDMTTGSTQVPEDNLHVVEGIDWNEARLVAIPFSIPSARTFMDAVVEEVEGDATYVIEVKDSPQNCVVTADMAQHIAFFERSTQQDTSLPVIIRTYPNSASCDF